MKKLTHSFIIFLLGVLFSVPGISQIDQSEGTSFQFDVPQNIQSLQQQIKFAEDTEDWDAYYSLRSQIITAWQEVKPEVAAMYRTTNNFDADQNNPTAPYISEIGNNQIESPLWGDDLLVHSGAANDISLTVMRDNTLYLGVLNNTAGGVSIYVSNDGGSNWSSYIGNFSVAASSKIELMDFDGYPGSTGPSYLLLFTLYDTGTLWCTRFELPGTSFANSQVVSTGCTDFSVDRNYPGANYRCFVLFDSASTQYHKRSDPASYATLWQDPYQISSCQDPDVAYGINGSLYLTYIGRNSGNLYLLSGYNYGDPTDFGTQFTVEAGATDTTFTPEIIASRQDTSTQTVIAVYTWLNNGRNDLRTVKKTGGAGWSSPANWSSFSNTDNKLVNLYCAKTTANDVFQASFTRTGLGNLTPRSIRYRKFSSGNWNGSTERSDASIATTGLQASSIVELAGGTAAFAYVGSGGTNVYFDNEDWVTDVGDEIAIPKVYALEQNYPNPFNPSTTIRFSVPENTNITLKVFNSIGQEVASLINGEIAAGNHSIDFNASALSSGVYFYRIQSPSFNATKKMILIK